MAFKFPYPEGNSQKLKSTLLLNTLVFLFICQNDCTSQSWEYSYENYTTKDGLPSDEVYDVIQDHEGYMWFATDNGLSRFDGYEFKNYGDKEGLTDRVIFDLQEDKHGRIWMNSLTKKMFYLNKNRDSIITIKSLENNGSKHSPLKVIYKYSNERDKLFCFYSGQDYLRIYNNITKTIEYLPFRDFTIFDLDSSFMYGFQNPMTKIHFSSFENKNKLIVKESINLEKDFSAFKSFLKLENHYILNRNNKFLVIDKKFHTIYTYYDDPIERVLKVKDKIISARRNFKGIAIHNNYNNLILNKPGKQYLNGFSISSLYNENKILWTTSTNKGIAKIRFVENLQKQRPTETISIFKKLKSTNCYITHHGYFLFSNKDLLKFNSKLIKNQFIKPYIFNEKLYFIDESRRVYYEKGNDFASLNPNEFNAIKLIQGKTKDEIISINSTGTWMYNIKTGFVKAIINNTAYYDGLRLDSCMYLCSLKGLTKLDNNLNIVKNDVQHPILTNRTDFIKKTKNNSTVIGTKNNGIAIIKGSKIEVFNETNHLLSNIIYGLYIIDKSIFIPTYKGITIITETNEGKYTYNYLTKYHGLPSEQVIDMINIENVVYISTKEGIFSVSLDNILGQKKNNFKPKLQEIKINNVGGPIDSMYTLKYNENNVSLKLITLNYAMNGDIQYQYKINNGHWNYLGLERTINLMQLSPGKYKIEYRSKNEDEIWSEAQSLSIVIRPPWWKTFWFYATMILAFISTTFLFFKRREKNIKQIAAYKDEINTLEKTALQAQMNPHFIFNSLNSIQNFILANDKEIASEYLFKFAKLIRLNLKATKSEFITLQDELDQIILYMELEKMRFKNRFEYDITTDEKLDKAKIMIPPMILQPIIENSIIHGFSKIKYQGLININIGFDHQQLNITIKDNGKGLSGKVNDSSMGTSITKKRIELLTKSNTSHFEINNYFDEEGRIAGVLCEIKINLTSS